jgi:transmembrane sensor
MSDSKEQPMQDLAGSEAIHAQAADWILKQRFEGSWNEQDQRELDSWLEQSTANLLAYLRLRAAWKQTDRLAALRGSIAPQPEHANSRWSFLTRIVAVLGLVAVAGVIGVNYFQRPVERIISTGIGEHQRLTMADGSLVELNTDTTIRVAANGPTRTVYLDKGEAYFQIKHEAAKPFVVIAGRHRVTDIGTAFVVRREPQQLNVSLVEGRARFDAPKDTTFKAIELKPGDEVVATAEGVSRTNKPVSALTEKLSWRHGVLIFYGTTLADAAREFSRYSETKLVIVDPKVAQLKINGTFQADNVQAFGDATQVVLGLRLETRNNEIVISR